MELMEIIQRFIRDQRYVVKRLHDTYGIAPDIKGLDWAKMYDELTIWHQQQPIATIFRPHGYGLEFKDDQVYIDYDYSHFGRPDGFDAWRLYIYVKDNGIPTALAKHEHFIDALRDLQKRGAIENEHQLYFLKQ